MKDRKLLVTCEHCTKEWIYKGRNNYNAMCPDCRKHTNIRKLTSPPMNPSTGEKLA